MRMSAMVYPVVEEEEVMRNNAALCACLRGENGKHDPYRSLGRRTGRYS